MKIGAIGFLTAAGLAAFAGAASGQCVIQNGTLPIIAGDNDTGLHVDDGTATVAFPFTVRFLGTDYTSAQVSSNGNLQFTGNNAAYTNDCLPSATIQGPALFPHWDDLRTDGGGGIYTTVSGTAPNQIFSIEWRATYFALGGTANFAIQFHQNSPTIDFVYGQIDNGGTSATVGVQDGQGGFTSIGCNSGGISSNTSITLTCAPSGACCTAAGCSIATRAGCAGTYNGDGTNCGVPSYSFANGAAGFNSIVGSGTMLGTVSNCDDCTESVSLPFSFTFYGNSYSTMIVSSNGNVQFGNSNSAVYINEPIPSAAVPNNAIYPLWDDYNPFQQGDIYTLASGTSPNQTFTVEWNDVTQYTAGNLYPLTSETFQVVLHEGTNTIDFNYGTITPTITGGAGQGTGVDASGGDRTIGVENANGTQASSIPSTTFTGMNQRLAFVPAPGVCGSQCGTADFDGDEDVGTDRDIEAFFRCLAGTCCSTCFRLGADFDADGDVGTDRDIEAFFRVLAGNPC